ncbi:hypothetical protein CFB89_09230 [Burkholderia sp. AU16741]|nr:hypothetical protein CFB89_09230 [Burkholderia sp. AU16741]
MRRPHARGVTVVRPRVARAAPRERRVCGQNGAHARASRRSRRRIDDVRRPSEFAARCVVAVAHPEHVQARRTSADAGFAAIARTMARRLQR